MEIYTNSMIKDWKLCKRKYYFKYIKKIFIPQKEENFELGKKVHALISYKLNGFNTSIVEKNATPEILEHYKSILKHPLLKQTPFVVEWGFSAKIGKTDDLFMGRIDAVFKDEQNGKYTIADWKTGMKIPENPILEPQAQIYLYAFYRAQKDLGIKINPEKLTFIFVQTPKLIESRLEFSQNLCQKFEDDFVQTIDEIKHYKQNNICEEKAYCKFCEYKFMCHKSLT